MPEYPYQIVEENKQFTRMMIDKKEIIADFEKIINSRALENDSNTPDFILAEYLFECLLAGQLMICKRSVWYNPEGKE